MLDSSFAASVARFRNLIREFTCDCGVCRERIDHTTPLSSNKVTINDANDRNRLFAAKGNVGLMDVKDDGRREQDSSRQSPSPRTIATSCRLWRQLRLKVTQKPPKLSTASQLRMEGRECDYEGEDSAR